jgi:hypothetical protein
MTAPRRLRALVLALALGSAVLAACGGGDGEEPSDPISQVTDANGIRAQVRAASAARKSDFPAVEGRTLQELADAVGGGGDQSLEMAMATSVFTPGTNRLAFGIIDASGFVYGKTAVYIARSAGERARGPYVAPADALVTEPRYRSKQAASDQAPFVAVYAAQVPFPRTGTWQVVAVTRRGEQSVATTATVDVISRSADTIPEVGERAPKVKTDTALDARGDLTRIDTRQPPSDMHSPSFDTLVGRKPVALLFATPQLCTSRVCGPVVDEALQLRARYGDRIAFIHQEVYVDNDPNKGYRPSLARFGLRTEPWLFVVGADGRITARLEGSFGLNTFETALKTAL